MRKSGTFLIESERLGHRLLVNGQKIATFATFVAAEAETNKVANCTIPGDTLRFKLGFQWTLTDFEIRVATLEWASAEQHVNESSNLFGRRRIGSRVSERE